MHLFPLSIPALFCIAARLRFARRAVSLQFDKDISHKELAERAGITKQRYGQVFFDSLPPYGFTTRLTDVEKFFDV